jgi:hypothetical protein
MHAGAIVGIIVSLLGALPQTNTTAGQQGCCCNSTSTSSTALSGHSNRSHPTIHMHRH